MRGHCEEGSLAHRLTTAGHSVRRYQHCHGGCTVWVECVSVRYRGWAAAVTGWKRHVEGTAVPLLASL
jgi:hypothetical protein